ncbi:MAG: hypothetical protein FD156_956 [Nitrospirae bacterium]|nr:MAG: hypothetical protein FD156_956 [Nitrospirota bacterium]
MGKGKNFRVCIISFLVLITLSGCAGTTKFMSEPLGSCNKFEPIPSTEKISIKMLRPIAAPTEFSDFAQQTFAKILAEKLKESQLYSEVNIVSSNDSISTPLLIEVAIANIGLGRQKRDIGYSSVGVKGEFSVAGRVVDVSKDKILIICEASRLSDRDTVPLTSGLFWEGIAITSEKSFIKNLMEWVAEDTVEWFKKLKEGGGMR